MYLFLVLAWLYNYEVLPILGMVLGEPFNNFRNLARNIAGDQIETFGCRNIVKVRHFLKFPEKKIDFIVMSRKCFQSLFQIGMRKIGF